MTTKSIKNEKAFSFTSLKKYPLKDRLLIHIADIAFYFMIKLLGRTIKYEVVNVEADLNFKTQDKLHIYALWHNDIFLGTYYMQGRNVVVLTSQSKDGEYIARFIVRMGYGAARGSSTRGGIGALVEMIRLMKKGYPAAFTVDGPKGPRHQAKPGAVLLAKKTGNPILPFVVMPARYWTVKSWDRLKIPKPFTKAVLIFGEPIEVNAKADDSEIERKTAELQRSLDDLARRSEEWLEKN